MTKAKFTLLSLALLLAFVSADTRAQSPPPIVVQAASPATAAAIAPPVPPTQESASIQAAIKTLEQIKAANQEILSKQKVALERLNELQQAAEQLKILAKRG